MTVNINKSINTLDDIHTFRKIIIHIPKYTYICTVYHITDSMSTLVKALAYYSNDNNSLWRLTKIWIPKEESKKEEEVKTKTYIGIRGHIDLLDTNTLSPIYLNLNQTTSKSLDWSSLKIFSHLQINHQESMLSKQSPSFLCPSLGGHNDDNLLRSPVLYIYPNNPTKNFLLFFFWGRGGGWLSRTEMWKEDWFWCQGV